jgi:acetyltransferase AlgX (SGNH hydrolase-like protein)
MSGKSNILIKRILFIIVVVLLSLPLFQQITEIVFVKPLKGAVKKTEKPEFTIDGWFSGKFQSVDEKFINTNFGFRSEFVRLHNQFDYWLFGEVNAKGVLIGKDGYLFEMDYINEYLGRLYLGKDKIDDHASKLKLISDSLESKGIDLVFLFAAGKASYYPEFFPESEAGSEKTVSNYEAFLSSFDSLDIKHIDLNGWFVKMKDTISYPLFTKGGIHWSKYGEYLVMDTIISYVEDLRGVKLPHFNAERISVSILPRYRDNDIGEGMNLIFPHSTFPMAYPKLVLDTMNADMDVKAMVLADSYYWEMYNEGFSKDIFNNGQFWYYNKEIFSSVPGKEKRNISEINVKNEVEKNDVVFILQTEGTLNRFTFGFVDNMYDIYLKRKSETPEEEKISEEEIAVIINNIRNSKGWYDVIVEKAKTRGISTEEMIRIDAIYVIRQERLKSRNSK